jgi:hypothetical protein
MADLGPVSVVASAAAGDDVEGHTVLAEVTVVGFDKEVRGIILEGGPTPIPSAARITE